MKLLLDENIPVGFIKDLKKAGHDVKHVLYECKGKKDREILDYAIKNKRCIVSFDADFCAFKEEKHCGIIKVSAKLDKREEALIELLSKLKGKDIADVFFQIDRKGAFKDVKIYGKKRPWFFKQYYRENIELECLCSV